MSAMVLLAMHVFAADPSLDDLLKLDAPKSAAVKKTEAPKTAEVKKPAEAPKVAEVKKPAEAPKPAEVKKPAEAPKVAEVKKPVEAPKPAEVKKPAEAPKVAEVKKPVEATKSAEVKKPVEAPKVAEVKKPVEVPKAAEKKNSGEVADEISLDDGGAEDSGEKRIVTLSNPDQTLKRVDADPSGHASGTEIAAKFLKVDETALVDIVSDDATLSDILSQFRKTTGANIIYAESTNLQQRVSVSLHQVPWLQAMTSILVSRGFRVESSGNIHFVREDKQVDPLFTRSFLLNHASVEDLAKLFNDSYGVKGPNGKTAHPVATAFPGANTVVVTAPERVLADCEKLIKAVDKAVPQIYIEARFIELSNQSMHKLGVQWNQLESWGATVKDISAGVQYENGHIASYKSHSGNKTGTSSSTSTSSSIGARGNGDSAFSTSFSRNGESSITKNSTRSTSLLSSDKINPTDGVRNVNGEPAEMLWRNARAFSGQLSADDFSIAMSAFEKLEDARIFSNPKVIVSNGREALVDMTTKYPNITVTSQHDTQSGYTRSDAKLEVIPGDDKLFAKSAFFSWGITLTVKPRISPDGLISVEIVPSISELDTDVTDTGFYTITGGSDAPYGTYPIIKYKRLTTDFTMKDGSTAVIGGLSKTEEGDIDSGIPYLREIPWIGNKLFGWKSRGKVQKEIIVFVTVGIADPADLPEDIGLPKNAVRGREYVDHRAQEPGDRPNAAAEALKLDMRPMEVQRRDYAEQSKRKPEAVKPVPAPAPVPAPVAAPAPKSGTASK